MNHASSCVLRALCKTANADVCNRICPHYLAIHGATGAGGRIGTASLPEEYRNLTISNVKPRDSEPEAFRLIDAYVGTFSRQFERADEPSKRIKSLYLWSPETGNGKTTTAAALLIAWITTHYIGSLQRSRQPLQRPALFVDVNELQTMYNGFNRSNVPQAIAEPIAERYYKTLENAKQTPFIVMDDLGVRSSTDGFRGDLHSIVNYRTVTGLSTVMTSNIPMEDLSDVFDRRLYDRARDMTVVVRFTGESKRGMRR